MVHLAEIMEQILRTREVERLLKMFQAKQDIDVMVQMENSRGLNRYCFELEVMDLLHLERLWLPHAVQRSEQLWIMPLLVYLDGDHISKVNLRSRKIKNMDLRFKFRKYEFLG